MKGLSPISYQQFINRFINIDVENLSIMDKKRDARERLIRIVSVKMAYFRPPQVPLMFLHCV